MSAFSPRLGDRTLFPELEVRAYLAHAAIAPVSIAVRAAVHAVLADYERWGARAFLRWDEQRRDLRGALARLIGGRAEEIALVPGTTRALTDIALSLPWQSGDRILGFAGEFPANVTPWQRAAALFGLQLDFLDADEYRTDEPRALERLERELERGARLVAVSAVEFQTGFRMPLERIGALCRAYGAELAVDAVQACGVVPVDVAAWGADYVVGGAHKFLMGLEGAGFAWIPEARASALRPYAAGWLSHEDPAEFLFEGPGLLRYDRPLRRDARVLEASTLNAVGFAALGASLGLILELGVPAIFEHVSLYLDRLEGELVERGLVTLRSSERARRSGILALEAPAGIDPVELWRGLGARGIGCSLPDGKLRFAPHWPNSISEVPLVLDAVDATLSELGGHALVRSR